MRGNRAAGHVGQKAADELVGRKRHDLLSVRVAAAVVLANIRMPFQWQVLRGQTRLNDRDGVESSCGDQPNLSGSSPARGAQNRTIRNRPRNGQTGKCS